MTGPDVAAAIMVTLVAILVIGFYVACHIAYDGVGRAMLRRWAAARGYTLIRVTRRRVFAKGPFTAKWPFIFRSSGHLPVYRVAVRDTDGRVRTGWVRCGTRQPARRSQVCTWVRWWAVCSRRRQKVQTRCRHRPSK